MAFAKLLRNLLRDPNVGQQIVPIVPDEARTFGMDPLFKQSGIYAPFGQRYEPVDSELLLSYRESRDGQVLEEGITEAGSMASFQAAATAYATHGVPTIPFYVFYSMFGFQRVGDQIWQSGDARGRGFLIGATAGRTTLAGEGLQHDDGHSQLFAHAMPHVSAYDPAFAYEMAALVRRGIERMHEKHEDVVYYLTIYNENQVQPRLPDGENLAEGIHRGLYRFAEADAASSGPKVRLLGSGAIMGSYEQTQRLLQGFLPPEKVDNLMEEIRGPAGRTMWDKLGNVNEVVLANYLKNEYPQTVAVVLSKIKSEHAARVLAALPEEFALEVVQRMLREKPAIRGIALPGMPSGSPGMAGPKTAPFKVLSFGPAGTKVYAIE